MNLPPARQALSRHNLHARVTIFPPRDIMFSRHLKLFPPSQKLTDVETLITKIKG